MSRGLSLAVCKMPHPLSNPAREIRGQRWFLNECFCVVEPDWLDFFILLFSVIFSVYFPFHDWLPGNYLMNKLKGHGRSTETVTRNLEWVLHCVDKQVVGLKGSLVGCYLCILGRGHGMCGMVPSTLYHVFFVLLSSQTSSK